MARMVVKLNFISIRTDLKHCREMSDQEMVNFYRKSKNKEVIGEFFNRYMHLVFAVCMRYFKNNEQAKDAVMEIFESLDDKLGKFEVKNFKGWIYKVSRNYCLMELRKKKTEIDIDRAKYFLNSDVENEYILHLEIKESIKENKIADLLEQLKACQRKCLEMMYYQNMSYKAISLKTGYSQKQVKSYIQNGKRKLRLLLSERK
jgi:RNA polymerase sigma-70 factor (ECF subfamily)